MASAAQSPSLIGTWRLVSFVTTDSAGVLRQYWDDRASGLIVYTADGHVSAQLYDARRARLGVAWDRAGAAAAQAAFAGMASYYGRYSVDAARGTVTHSIEGAMSPDWIGSELVRGYRFLGSNRVELRVLTSAEGPVVGNTVLVWERVTSAVTILPADLDDAEVQALLQEHLTTATATTPPESAHALDLHALRAADVSVWAAWDGSALLGVGALKRLSRDHGEIKSMHTARQHRGRGVGSAMLLHIIDAAHANGMLRLSLETGAPEYFRPARELYRRHGFVECPPFADYVPDPNSVFMTREL